MLQNRYVKASCVGAAMMWGVTVGLADAEAKKPASPYAQQITELRATNAVLAQADHDYKGHRVKAMKQVHAAIHALKSGTKGTKNPFKGPKGKGKLPQDQSDKLLRKALDELREVKTQLGTVQDARATAALVAIEKAMDELHIALKIK